MGVEQNGIKWWKVCPVCTWAAKSRGAIADAENALDQCPNCNNPKIGVLTDEDVFHVLRYDVRVRNDREQVVADEVRQNQGRPPAPPDTVNTGNQGFQYASDEDKPFDEDGNPQTPPARVIEIGEDPDPSVGITLVHADGSTTVVTPTPGNGG